MRVARQLVAFSVAGLVVAASATAAPPLVLRPGDTPGLRPRAATVADAERTLAAAVRPARLPPLSAVHGQASRFAGPGLELWSIAFVLRGPHAAQQALRQATVARSLVRSRAGVGDQGWILQRRGQPWPVVLLWRRRAVLEAVVLTGVPATQGRELAVAYARFIDARLQRLLAETAWDRTLDRVRPDGRVPRSVAFDLFALAYGPLPGTKRPSGSAGGVDGTTAAFNILRIWPTLSPAQQQVVAQRLGLAGVDLTPGGTSGLGVPLSTPPNAAEAAPPNYGDPRFTPDDELTKAANGWAQAYADNLGHTLDQYRIPGFRIVAGKTTEPIPGTHGEALADTGAVNDRNGKFDAAANVCRIRLSVTGQALHDIHLDVTLAHEVFHCFEFAIIGPISLLFRPNWVIEGSAEWAALNVTPVVWGDGEEGFLRDYLKTCGAPLFARSYSAVGFFGSAQDTFGDDLIWTRVRPFLTAGTSEASFRAAGGSEDVFLDSWASWMALESGWNLHWWLTRPLVPTEDAKCVPTPIGPSGGRFGTTAHAGDVFRVTAAPAKKPLLHVSVRVGHARLSDGKLDTNDLRDAWFCTARDTRACTCPPDQQGKVPPAPQLSLPADIGITGGRVAGSGAATFVSVKQFCKKKQKPPKPPPRSARIGGGPSCRAAAAAGRIDACGGPPGCGGGCGGSNGDPHLHMFDDVTYDFQAAGEFTLVRSNVDDLEVQAREEEYPGLNTLAVNTAVAMRVAGDRVGVYGSALSVRLNGGGFVAQQKPTRLPHGGTISSLDGQIEVQWPDGTIARVWSVGHWGVAVLVRPAPSRQGSLSGLLGNFDGVKDNDFVTRTGRRLPSSAVIGNDLRSYHLLYKVFGDSWRITQRQSLFEYAPGQSTGTFTNRRFPSRLVTPDSLSAHDRRIAEQTCRRMKISNPRIFRDCIVDVGGTGDGSFATAGRELELTAGRFGTPSRGGGGGQTGGGSSAAGSWTSISTGGKSGIFAPSLALDGGKVVAAYGSGTGSAEAVTFTPSAARDVAGLRRDPIASGWNQVNNLSLLPRAGGGLQLLFNGIRSTQAGEPLFGQILIPRNPDGSFGTPVLATGSNSGSLGGAAVLAPSGEPLWAAASIGFWLWRGGPNAVGAELQGLAGPTYIPSVGRDGQGRYWLAWFALGSAPPTRGVYLVQIDPATLRPLGAPQRAPESDSLQNLAARLALACSSTCHVVYLASATRLDSWSYGQAKPTLVFRAAARTTIGPRFAAAYTTGGRLWVAWWADAGAKSGYRAKLGDGAGAGGTQIAAGRPTRQGLVGGTLSAIADGNDLVLVANWPTRSTFTRSVNVVTAR